MAAILRVKRRNDDEPLNALILACKRRKTTEDDVEDSVNTPLKTIVKFAGTVKNQEDDVVEHLVKTLGKDELKSNFKKHSVDILNKMRQETKDTSVENRYKVISCLRSLNTSNIEELDEKGMTVIDVEDSVSCAAKVDVVEEEDDAYVYDLYYAQTEADKFDIDNMVSVHTMDQELVFDTYRNNCGVSEDECESEDSNSESNWRNDYPDSDHSEESINESHMMKAVEDMRLGDSSDLSSDDDFVNAVNEDDVEQHGYRYAKYKLRVNKELNMDQMGLEQTVTDEEDSDYSDSCTSEDEDS